MDTSKSHRKRLRRNRNAKFKSNLLGNNNKNFNKTRVRRNNTQTTSLNNTVDNKTKVPETDMPKDQEKVNVSDEELLNNIAANITATQHENPPNLLVSVAAASIPQNEIFFADEIPQCITDDIVLSSSSNSTMTPISDGPSVIVEYLPTMDTFDENELNGLINLNEQELIDRFLNCGDDHEIFVN